MSSLALELAGWAAGLAGLLYLGRKVLTFLRLLDRVAAVIARELEHNGGSTIRDDVHSIAVHVGQLEAGIDELRTRMGTLEALRILGYQEPAHDRKEPPQ